MQHLAEDLEYLRQAWEAAVPGVDASPLLLAWRMGAVARMYEDLYSRLLANEGLMLTEYWVLGIMRSDPRGVGSPSDLARLTRRTPAGMTKTLDRLERGGLVERQPHPSARRRTEIRLTPEGADKAERIFSRELIAVRKAFSDMSATELRRLHDTLDDLLQRIDAQIDRDSDTNAKNSA